jgi:hypothetical protein
LCSLLPTLNHGFTRYLRSGCTVECSCIGAWRCVANLSRINSGEHVGSMLPGGASRKPSFSNNSCLYGAHWGLQPCAQGRRETYLLPLLPSQGNSPTGHRKKCRLAGQSAPFLARPPQQR